jgi:hypothetical protein
MKKLKREKLTHKHLIELVMNTYVAWAPNRPTSAIFGGVHEWAYTYHRVKSKVNHRDRSLRLEVEIDITHGL